MGARQPIRGNPEAKNVYLTAQFQGGINVTFSDDLIPDNELRDLMNFDLDSRGQLQGRKGFSKNTPLSQLFFSTTLPADTFPPLTKTDSHVKNYILFKILENTNSSWKKLSESPSLAYFQSTYCAQPQRIKTLLVAELLNGTVKFYIQDFGITSSAVTRNFSTGVLPFAFKGSNNLMNIEHAEQYKKIYFTSNDKGVVMFDSETDTFSYIGNFGVGIANKAYKPNALQARKIGFNLLTESPLDWVSLTGGGFSGIESLYISSLSRIPLLNIPIGEKFYVNIYYTGTVGNFKFQFKDVEGDVNLEFTATKNTVLSTGVLAVYEIDFITQPTQTVEIIAEFDDAGIFLNPYIDVYQLGYIPENAQPVMGYNVGEWGITQVFDRVVFYKGNVLMFSEINNFEYVPSYNYILLPISNTDKIVKISYFRNSYIIFTQNKIFRLSGTFGASNFNLALINDEVGCLAGDTVAMVENELYFLSTRGLRSLKTDVFRENLDNLREFDDKVRPLVTNNERAYGIVYEDKYLLFSNLGSSSKEVVVNGKGYSIPAILTHYYKTGAFVYYTHALNSHPRFIFSEGGKLLSFMSVSSGVQFQTNVYEFGRGYDDFDSFYWFTLETSGLNFGYPIHEKKVKNIVFKMAGSSAGLKQFVVELFSNGRKVSETLLEEKVDTVPIDLESSEFRMDKTRIPAKFKNLSIRITTSSELGVNLSSISYVYKLGKVRE